MEAAAKLALSRSSITMGQRPLATSSATKSSSLAKKLLVIGGNGYVGSHVAECALSKGHEVRSFNRSGKPAWQDTPWVEKVDWVTGDVFDQEALKKAMDGVSGVVTAVGAFGSDEFMEKINGDANIVAADTAKSSGVERFVFISSSRVGTDIPKWAPLQGYFHGKLRAEGSVKTNFPETGVSLRPGFIYGSRRVGSVSLPLSVFGCPMTFLSRDAGGLSSIMSSIPFFGAEMHSAVPVETVAEAAVYAATHSVDKQHLDVDDMMKIAEEQKPNGKKH